MINLKEKFGIRYKTGYDEAGAKYHRSKIDKIYLLILCKFGNIYPYSDTYLAFHCCGRQVRNRLHTDHPEIKVRNWSDDGEAIFLFRLEQFDIIAEYARPRKRRIMSRKHEEKPEIEVSDESETWLKSSSENSKSDRNRAIKEQAV